MLWFKYAYLFCFSLILFNGFGQSADSIYCEGLLSKPVLSSVDFERLDSVIFSMNYYTSETPLNLYHRARTKAIENNQPEYALTFEIMMADLFYELSNLDSSSYYAHHAASVSKELGEDLMYARTANIRRLVSSVKTDFSDAYEICFEALEIFEKYGDQSGIAITNRDIGSIMLHEKKYDDALVYCMKAVDGLLAAKDWYELTFSYQRIAITYRNMGKYALAHAYIQKAMDACRKLDGFRVNQGLAKKYWTRGYIYEAQEDFEKAIVYYDSAKVFAETVNYYFIDRALHNSKGAIFLKQEKFEKAMEEFNQSLASIARHHLKQNAYDYYTPIYANLVETYEGLGEYQKANEYLKKLTSAKDSIFKMDSEKLKTELQTKYETVQKEQTIATLQEDKKTQQRFLLLGGFLLASLVLAALLLWRNNRYRARINQQLQDQKSEIQRKSDQNELLLKEIHHRVKNNLQIISSLLNIQAENIEDVAAFDAIQESKNRVTSMSLIHQKLYMGENLASIEMRNYFETMGSAILEGFGSKADHIDLEVEMPEIEMDVDAAIPVGLITNELISNSIKYAFPEKKGGRIKISLEQLDNHEFKLIIADNGTPTQGQEKSKDGTGFGSLLVQLLTAQLGGKIDVSTKEGTAAIIHFPPQIKSAV
jgi:two-component sensor histidine kinase